MICVVVIVCPVTENLEALAEHERVLEEKRKEKHSKRWIKKRDDCVSSHIDTLLE